jgi:hypothetical protein
VENGGPFPRLSMQWTGLLRCCWLEENEGAIFIVLPADVLAIGEDASARKAGGISTARVALANRQSRCQDSTVRELHSFATTRNVDSETAEQEPANGPREADHVAALVRVRRAYATGLSDGYTKVRGG